MLPSLRYSVSCALAFRPSSRHIVQQLTSHRRLTVASHKLEGNATQAPDSDHSAEDKVEEKGKQELLGLLEKQQVGFLQFIEQQEKRHVVELMELHNTTVDDSKRDASKIAALVGLAWKESTAKRKLQQKFNVRGALESRAFYCTLDDCQWHGYRKHGHPGGTQGRLNYLSQSAEFKEILDSEAKARDLVPSQVTQCVEGLYHSLSKYAHGHDGTIILKAADYCPNELAALVVFFKFQSTRPGALAWREEASEVTECVMPDDMEKALGIEMRGGREGDGGAVAGAEMEVSTKDDTQEAGGVDILQAMEEEEEEEGGA